MFSTLGSSQNAQSLSKSRKDDAVKAAPSESVDTPHITSGFWFAEEITPSLHIRMKLNRITFDEQSKFQKAQIVETEPFGKTLVLDGKTQSALSDEFVYHESLVHPALLAHPNPRRVFIGGGGELATAREVLKHNSVEKVVMVDIDETVVEICKTHMPEWSDNAHNDKRLDIIIDDAKGYLESHEDLYDVIIMDIADPIEAGPGIALYFEEFYKFVTSRLTPGGIFVTQSGPGSIMNITECCSVIHQTLRKAFDHVLCYSADIPSFGSNWGFNMAFNSDSALASASSMSGSTPLEFLLEQPISAVEKQIEKRVSGDLKYFDGTARRGLFGLPKSVRRQLDEETRVMTKDDPVFMY